MDTKEERLQKLSTLSKWWKRLRWWVAAIGCVLVYLASGGGGSLGARVAAAVGFAIIGKLFFEASKMTYEWAKKTHRDWPKWIHLPTLVFSVPIVGLLWYYVDWASDEPVGWPTKVVVSLLGVAFCVTCTSMFMSVTYYREGTNLTGQPDKPPSPFWLLVVVMLSVPGILLLWLAFRAFENVT